MIVAGFGFRSAATRDSLSDAFARAGGQADSFATAEDKALAPAMVAFSEQTGVHVIGVPAGTLTSQITQTRSNASQTARDTGSVAEAAALAAAGPSAKLLGPRVVSADRMATCALAEGDPT